MKLHTIIDTVYSNNCSCHLFRLQNDDILHPNRYIEMFHVDRLEVSAQTSHTTVSQAIHAGSGVDENLSDLDNDEIDLDHSDNEIANDCNSV